MQPCRYQSAEPSFTSLCAGDRSEKRAGIEGEAAAGREGSEGPGGTPAGEGDLAHPRGSPAAPGQAACRRLYAQQKQVRSGQCGAFRFFCGISIPNLNLGLEISSLDRCCSAIAVAILPSSPPPVFRIRKYSVRIRIRGPDPDPTWPFFGIVEKNIGMWRSLVWVVA